MSNGRLMEARGPSIISTRVPCSNAAKTRSRKARSTLPVFTGRVLGSVDNPCSHQTHSESIPGRDRTDDWGIVVRTKNDDITKK